MTNRARRLAGALLCAALFDPGGLAPAGASVAAPRPVVETSPCRTFTAVAHKGVRGDGVDENTLVAFDRAAAHGHAIETDVRPDADGRLWIYHDGRTRGLTGKEAAFAELTSAQVERKRYRREGSRVLALDDLVPWLVAHPEVPVYLEPKMRFATLAGPGRIDVPRAVAQALADAGRLSGSWLTAHNDSAQLHQDFPDLGMLEKISSTAPDPQVVADEGFDTVAITPGRLTAEVVASYHAVGITVQGQNSRRTARWRAALRAGADALLTNDPDGVVGLCRTDFTAPVVRGSDSRRAAPGDTVAVTGRGFTYLRSVRVRSRTVRAHVVTTRRLVLHVPRRLRLGRITITTDYGTARSSWSLRPERR